MKEGMFEGTFDCGRWSGGGKDGFSLVVTDKTSNLVVFQAEIDPTAMILALTGRGALPIHFKLAPPEVAAKVGMIRTVRVVKLTGEEETKIRSHVPSYRKPNPEHLKSFREYVEAAALVQICKEDGSDPVGWRLDSDGHRSQQTEGWTVSMERFDPPIKPWDEKAGN